jgi:hypothetical protein
MRLWKIALTPLLLWALPAGAAYDIRGIAIGTTEKDLVRALPSAHCKKLEWESKAATRRCDDSRVPFGGVEVKVTFYLRKDVVEAFDLRFDTKDLDRFVTFLKGRYGPPQAEGKDEVVQGTKKRQLYKARWENAGQHAVLVAQLEQRRASMLVSRGDFDEEIYKVR